MHSGGSGGGQLGFRSEVRLPVQLGPQVDFIAASPRLATTCRRRETAFAKIRARAEGTKLAETRLG